MVFSKKMLSVCSTRSKKSTRQVQSAEKAELSTKVDVSTTIPVTPCSRTTPVAPCSRASTPAVPSSRASTPAVPSSRMRVKQRGFLFGSRMLSSVIMVVLVSMLLSPVTAMNTRLTPKARRRFQDAQKRKAGSVTEQADLTSALLRTISLRKDFIEGATEILEGGEDDEVMEFLRSTTQRAQNWTAIGNEKEFLKKLLEHAFNLPRFVGQNVNGSDNFIPLESIDHHNIFEQMQWEPKSKLKKMYKELIKAINEIYADVLEDGNAKMMSCRKVLKKIENIQKKYAKEAKKTRTEVLKTIREKRNADDKTEARPREYEEWKNKMEIWTEAHITLELINKEMVKHIDCTLEDWNEKLGHLDEMRARFGWYLSIADDDRSRYRTIVDDTCDVFNTWVAKKKIKFGKYLMKKKFSEEAVTEAVEGAMMLHDVHEKLTDTLKDVAAHPGRSKKAVTAVNHIFMGTLKFDKIIRELDDDRRTVGTYSDHADKEQQLRERNIALKAAIEAVKEHGKVPLYLTRFGGLGLEAQMRATFAGQVKQRITQEMTGKFDDETTEHMIATMHSILEDIFPDMTLPDRRRRRLADRLAALEMKFGSGEI